MRRLLEGGCGGMAQSGRIGLKQHRPADVLRFAARSSWLRLPQPAPAQRLFPAAHSLRADRTAQPARLLAAAGHTTLFCLRQPRLCAARVLALLYQEVQNPIHEYHVRASLLALTAPNPLSRGRKVVNFPGSRFLRAKTFRMTKKCVN